MYEILKGILQWFWGLCMGAKELATWLFTPLSENDSQLAQLLSNLFSFIGINNITPMGLVGISAGIGGAIVITIGIIRAIA